MLHSLICSLVLALVSTASPVGRAASLDLRENDHIVDHRQHAGRASAVRRLARSQAPRAVSEARPRLSQPRLQRRRGRDAPSIEELRHAGRVAERQAGADRRLSGEPLRRRQHAGRRHLRVLRLQRVVRRRGRTAGVPAAADRVDPAHAVAAVQRAIGAAGRVVLADRSRRSRQSGPSERAREQRAARALHERDG